MTVVQFVAPWFQRCDVEPCQGAFSRLRGNVKIGKVFWQAGSTSVRTTFSGLCLPRMVRRSRSQYEDSLSPPRKLPSDGGRLKAFAIGQAEFSLIGKETEGKALNFDETAVQAHLLRRAQGRNPQSKRKCGWLVCEDTSKPVGMARRAAAR